MKQESAFTQCSLRNPGKSLSFWWENTLLWQCENNVHTPHCGFWGRFCVWWWWCDFLVGCWRKYGGGGGRTPPPPTPQTALSSSLHSSVDIMYNALTTALCCTAAVQSTQLQHFIPCVFQKEFKLIIHLVYICKIVKISGMKERPSLHSLITLLKSLGEYVF